MTELLYLLFDQKIHPLTIDRYKKHVLAPMKPYVVSLMRLPRSPFKTNAFPQSKLTAKQVRYSNHSGVQQPSQPQSTTPVSYVIIPQQR
jgi:hypothetical protein